MAAQIAASAQQCGSTAAGSSIGRSRDWMAHWFFSGSGSSALPPLFLWFLSSICWDSVRRRFPLRLQFFELFPSQQTFQSLQLFPSPTSLPRSSHRASCQSSRRCLVWYTRSLLPRPSARLAPCILGSTLFSLLFVLYPRPGRPYLPVWQRFCLCCCRCYCTSGRNSTVCCILSPDSFALPQFRSLIIARAGVENKYDTL